MTLNARFNFTCAFLDVRMLWLSELYCESSNDTKTDDLKR